MTRVSLQSVEAAEENQLGRDYGSVRAMSETLCAPLATEDYCIQTMDDVSPPKWHLAHTSWFFETFILGPCLQDYQPYHPQFAYLFNSYYEQAGRFHPRPQRGLLSRPTVGEVLDYRHYVDRHMQALLNQIRHPQRSLIEGRLRLGLNHEQQHQELLLTDIKHIFGCNPLRPMYRDLPAPAAVAAPAPDWLSYRGGLSEIGADPGQGFIYDNEAPRHRVYLQPFRLASRAVTNAEYLAFIDDGGYRRPELWMSEGWKTVQDRGWQAPLYWERQEDGWWHMTLGGMRPVDAAAPVCHVSFYEADAYARWRGARLPTEAEWEVAVAGIPMAGNFRDADRLQPMAAVQTGLTQVYGDVWEWTASAYGPYPGYRPPAGVLGEYNGKFMCSQMVLRGGSCVTPQDHLRPSYRNFFYPGDRWQFSGIRLAQDA